MADLLENPPEKRGSALPENAPPSAVPQVIDGAVYLPKGKPVAPDSREFDDMLRKNLPSEIVPDVLTNWRGISSRTRWLQHAAALLVLAVFAVLLFILFPPAVHPDLSSHSRLAIREDLTPELSPRSPYRTVYDKAVGSFNNAKYHEVCKILKPSVEEIVRSRNLEAGRVAFLYFEAIRRLSIPPASAASREAAGLLRKLADADRDNPVWQQFYFEISPQIRFLLDYEQVKRVLVRTPPHPVWRETRLQDLDLFLEQLENLRGLTRNKADGGKNRYSSAEKKEYEEHYDLFRMELLISRWLLAGGFPARLPDNEDDPGVRDREDALQIAMSRRNSRYNEFWKARRFIAETLISRDSWVNHIFWNKRYRKTKDDLIAEIDKCNEHLEGSRRK
ncbi:MAG: hypothetical protein IJS14_13615 [Lentisphaeria bacterium]|nr:hypothetical protein [Lentisphaeria bacterium]